VTGRRRQPGLFGLFIISFIWLAVFVPLSTAAAPYAAYVIDARNGEVLYSRNAEARLHPASLTKMMTLYIAFEAVKHGEISMDTMVRVSRNAASEPPSKLGLREGQRIKLRYLVRAAAVKSANDAATAIGEAIAGSESAFADRMNRTAKAMGMTKTTFKNANGLTQAGHLSTARDMTLLGQHLIYDYPEYYNLFSRQTADAGIKTVSHTNRRLLQSYQGADGIKTGYTQAAGFNLVASARRGNERIIATVFGGRSTLTRNAKVAELLDLGFKRAPSRVTLRTPPRPPYQGNVASGTLVASVATPGKPQARSVRVAAAAVKTSLRPVSRPGDPAPAPLPAPVVASADVILEALEEAQAVSLNTGTKTAPVTSPKPVPRPASLTAGVVEATAVETATVTTAATPDAEVVTRLSTSGGRHWGINVGRYPTRYQAERVLLKTALAEMTTLDGSLRKVVSKSNGHDADFIGLTREMADLACRRLQARQMTCFMIGPE
jgi:D-alanyl-D-alanine carboxypeptidase